MQYDIVRQPEKSRFLRNLAPSEAGPSRFFPPQRLLGTPYETKNSRHPAAAFSINDPVTLHQRHPFGADLQSIGSVVIPGVSYFLAV
jgi:hypothetical protein